MYIHYMCRIKLNMLAMTLILCSQWGRELAYSTPTWNMSHLEHESALGCMRVHKDIWSALGSWECNFEHESAQGCMRVHLGHDSALGSWECTRLIWECTWFLGMTKLKCASRSKYTPIFRYTHDRSAHPWSKCNRERKRSEMESLGHRNSHHTQQGR